jgi:anaerobic ribonucleoside-triphosphate reductase activating protein
MRIHSLIPQSLVNGPGRRFTIWFQGCNFNCPGCFNPQTHDLNGGYEITMSALLDQIIYYQDVIDGVTISGGEPFLQPVVLKNLLQAIKEMLGLSLVVYTGYDYQELSQNIKLNECLSYIDVLIAGRYRDDMKNDNLFLSSSNQEMIFLSDKYSIEDFSSLAEAEIIINQAGEIITSGKLDSKNIRF